jgi:5-(aminomethyl)-3-furanmethanol phosphate kinase
MVVIKLGGSLLTYGKLKECLDKIESEYQGRAVVIVPGGSVFADQVRLTQQQWQFNDHAAHWMALLAMQQMAILINAIKLQFPVTCGIPEINYPHICVWAPDFHELLLTDLVDSYGNLANKSLWDITSDSISAWLARQLNADELIVVKSATIGDNDTVQELTKREVVDAGFEHYIQQLTSCKLTVINAEKFLS